MWSFLHGVLNNDVLAITLATATVLALVHALQAERPRARGAIAIGALLGLAALTKLTALCLAPLALATAAELLVRARRAGTLRVVVRHVALAAAVAAAVGGWWFVRNVALYGDPLAMAAHDASFPALPAEHRWTYFTGVFLPDAARSLLGTFGWFSQRPPVALVWTGSAVAAIAVLGLVRACAERERPLVPRPAWLLLGAIALVGAGAAWFNLRVAQPQGRLLLPAAGPAAVLLAAGLVRASAALPHRRWLTALLPLTAALVLLVHFRPAFAPELAPAPPWHRALVGAITAPPRTPGVA